MAKRKAINKKQQELDDEQDQNKEQEQDELIPDPVVFKEFNICAMTGWRWDHDPEMAALGWPAPAYIRKRKYRSRRLLEKFKESLMRHAIKTRKAEAV